MKEAPLWKLSDDIILNILLKLEDDPRDWSRLACVSTKFSALIRTFCWRSSCLSVVPSVAADLCPAIHWATLHSIAVCCPGLHHAGVFLENSDFGLQRGLGPDENYHRPTATAADPKTCVASCSSSFPNEDTNTYDHCWSLYDDLYYDTIYDNSDSHAEANSPPPEPEETTPDPDVVAVVEEGSFAVSKSRKMVQPAKSHLASGACSLSREQGNKLLASRFRRDTLYICDWPGCVHAEEKRNYMVFRGIFKEFKKTGVWRTINDGQWSKSGLNCAFCMCKETWDLQSAFCLKRFGYHDDGEPVVRAFVCENGHVSGAWTDLPLYT